MPAEVAYNDSFPKHAYFDHRLLHDLTLLLRNVAFLKSHLTGPSSL